MRTDTALLLMDMQTAIVEEYAYPELAVRAADAATAARRAGVPVVFVAPGYRPGHPEIHPNNRRFAMVAQAGRFVIGGADSEWHPPLSVGPTDLLVTKRRVSAFSGSDLEMLLRARGVGNLVLGGVSTSGVVLSTFCQAADLDFRVAVLEDCCADPDADAHRVLMTSVFARQGEVIGSAGWAASLDT